MRIPRDVVTSPITRDPRESPSLAATSADATASTAAIVQPSPPGAAAATEIVPAAATMAATTTAATRLQAIRAMIDKGDYPVDLDVLALRIVEDELRNTGR
ncbi:MAG TPA: hypothetical protein VFT22_22170 [Kofleriaceae bacterium]|nr:hypothetical protein [Kofleriaceae bacterium]